MKRSIEALVVVPMLLVIVAMAILGVCGIARAEPAQQFSFQVKGVSAERLVVRVLVRSFDTTGAVPPTPTAFEMRLPGGVRLNRAFLNAHWLCDGRALRDAIDARPSGTPFIQRIAHLDAFARELERSHAKADRAVLPNVRACERARLGGGTGLIDARAAIRALTDPIPVGFSMFLSRGTVPGAIAGLTVLGAADERAPIVRKYPVVAGVHAVLTENFVSDPSPDGLYGMKLMIYTGPIAGFQVSIAEIDVKAHTLSVRKGTCLARGRGSRCTRLQRADAALFSVPRCPPAGHFNAQLYTAFPPPLVSLSTSLEVPCPSYVS